MRKTHEMKDLTRRGLALLLALVMVAGYIPNRVHAAEPEGPLMIADNSTWDRLDDIYGNNTLHSGKVSVDKSVSVGNADGEVTVDGRDIPLKQDDSFLVNLSQSAQVMALTTEMQVPVDVVFVLDTSGSMGNDDREASMVAAANSAIKTLMAANSHNRVGVVAFSDIDGSGWNVTPAATVLTRLDHYDAFDNHLTYSGSNLVGRGTGAGSRDGSNGGTNIQAGVAMGAQMLAKATDITVDGVTRIPFLIILSDGAPTYNFSDSNWYNPGMTGSQYGPGNDNGTLYAGNGFLPALVAAYYKGVITEHYYGDSASEDNRCSIYSLGVSIDDSNLARLTMDPKTNFNANATGNSHSGRFATYWRNYQGGSSFSISSGYGESLTISQNSINATKNYVNGISSSGKKMYEGSIRYNDGYYSANNTEEINGIFDSVIEEIAQKAISVPTRVTTTSEFDGYVTFTDIIGEYMEVKQMHGVLVGDTFYQGRYVARNIGNNGKDSDFDTMLKNVIATRITMANANVSKEDALDEADKLIEASVGATYNGRPTQAFYNETTGEYSNSVVWFGQSYTSGDDFEHGVRYISPAVDDSYEYLTDANSASAIAAAKAAGANAVCRSYFLYGTAETAGGSQTTNHNNEYMYFMIRVERSLEEPYQQTVTVSVPASLLSMDKVYVTEDAEGNTTVKLEEADPTHVLYEVGLRSDINAYNLANKVSSAYKQEAPADGRGHVNNDGDTYYFFTNDWDRSMSADTHTRAQSKATFYAASNNSYYTYQEKTYLYEKSGNNFTIYNGSNPQGKTLYYMRDVYTWESAANADGEHQAKKTQEAIEVIMPASIPADSTQIAKDSTGWYIAKGVYTGSVANHCAVEHVAKAENKTDTSIAVDHPHRTGDLDDPHYTIYLGNNGVLGLQPQKSKTVSIDLPTNSTTITDDNGKPVMVGQELTYTIDVVNTTDKTADVTATDVIPSGTTLVAGSITEGGVEKDGVITWNFARMASGASKTVSFKVLVTEAALTGEVEVNDITNTAQVKIGNQVLYNTNPTKNPPEGKKSVAGSDTQVIEGPLQVGNTITYRIRFVNDAVDAQGNPVSATVTVTDVIPAGTHYYVDQNGEGSASHKDALVKGNGTDLTTVNGKPGLKWVFEDMLPGASGTVSFKVVVDASAKQVIENDANITVGDHDPHTTNKTSNEVGEGKVSVSKVVSSAYDHGNKEFTIVLTDNTGKLSGNFTAVSNKEDRNTTVTFTNGIGSLNVLAGETFTVEGLPLGVTLGVSENQLGTGWSQAISSTSVTASNETVPNATVTNTYRVQPVKFQLKGTKNFTGVGFPAGINFIFDAVQVDQNGNVINGGIHANATATSAANKTSDVFAFNTSTFTAPIDRYYKITEQAVNNISGLTCSNSVYYLHLVVSEDRDNAALKLDVEFKAEGGEWRKMNLTTDADGVFTNDGSQVLFENVYRPLQSEPVQFSGTKTLEGRYLNANDFSFQLVSLVNPGSGEGVVIDTVTNGEGSATIPSTGSFTFNPIVYTAAQMVDNDGNPVTSKTFNYAVREVQGNAENTTYDKTLYWISVTVTDEDGKLVAGTPVISQYLWDEAENKYVVGEGKTVAYHNEFEITNANVILTGKKILTGDGAEKLEAGDFSFKIVEANADWTETNVVVAVADNKAGTKVENSDDLEALIEFSPINFKPEMFANETAQNNVKTKTFYYIVKEDVPLEGNLSRDPSMVYDETKHKVTVTATYNVATGEIIAEITEVDGVAQAEGTVNFGDIAFTNKRNEQSTLYYPNADKIILVDAGKDLPSNLRFSFRVTNLLSGALEGTGISAAVPAGTQGVETTVAENTYDKYTASGSFTGMEFDYTDVGNTFWYVLEEAAVAENNGVKYDTTKYILKLVISKDAEGALKVTDSYYTLGHEITLDALKTAINQGDILDNFLDTTNDISFTNIFDADHNLNISATKEFTGRPLSDNEFMFRLQLINSDGTLASSVINGFNAANGVVTFGTLSFTTEQMTEAFLVETKETKETVEGEEKVVETAYTYEYNALLSEVIPETAKLAGVTYDPSKYIVSIRWTKTIAPGDEGDVTNYGDPYIYAVYKAAEGSAENTYVKDGNPVKTSFTENNGIIDLGVKFSNSYTYSGTSITFNAKKTLSGRPLKANEFGFELYRYDAEKGEVYITSTTNAADGTITFKREYTRANLDAYLVDNVATLVYHIKEIHTAMGGITYSGADYWVKVVVEHDVNSASLKTPVVTYYENYENGTFSGELTADEVTFDNTYETIQATFTPTASKSLLGAENKALSLEGYSFSFEVVEVEADGTVKMVTDEGNKQHSKVVSTGHSNADGTVTFTAIHFNHQDAASWIKAEPSSQDYYFMMREDAGSAEGVTYDSDPVYLKVTVSHDGNGKLEATAFQYYSDIFTTAVESAAFENHYGPGSLIFNLDLNKTVVISGREEAFDFDRSDFDFILYQDMDANSVLDLEIDQEINRGTNGDPGEDNIASISLGSLVYTSDMLKDEEDGSKDFHYLVVEDSVVTAGITSDTGMIKVVVTVTDDGYGNMTATAKYSKINANGVAELDEAKQNLFTNVYTATPAKFSLEGTKTLINKALDQNEFTFVITEDANNPTKIFGDSGKKEVTNDAGNPYQGNITFLEDQELKAPGMYTFTITEKKENKAGYTYDSSSYTVLVKVIDTYQGTLEVEYIYFYVGEVKDENKVGNISFTNSYTPEKLTSLDLDLAISARKQIVDSKGNVIIPADDNDILSGFLFEIVDNKGNNVFGEGKYGVSNKYGEIIDFPTFSFPIAGEYHYIIREVDEEKDHRAGFTYDDAQWTLHILVRYNDGSKEVTYQDGEETVTVPAGALYIIPSEVHTFPATSSDTTTDNDQTDMEPVFSNVYDPTSASVTITATKELNGRAMKANEFKFQLVDSKGLIHGQTTNNADGSVKFVVNYTLADMVDEKGKTVNEKTFTYTIQEVIPQNAKSGKLDGVTYATGGKTVSVTVVNDNGALKIGGKNETTVATGAVITNSYTAKNVDATILAQKYLTGADVKAFKFDFELVDKAGKIEVAQNDSTGKVTFKKTYTFADMVDDKGNRVTEKVFTYTLREKAGTLAGMTYDKTEITVKVTVTDDQKGNLSAVVTYSVAPNFNNSYEGPTAIAVIEASKTLSGKALKGDDFIFELVGEDGKAVTADVKNDVNGDVRFSMQYEAAGTYTYILREKAGDDKHITYDAKEYKVVVTVTANENGNLTAAVKYDTADGKIPVFKNVYTRDDLSLIIEATKTLTGRKIKAEEFKFRVHDSQGNLVATGTNDADGKITFSAITFKDPGTYELTVSEVNSGARGMTYDKTKFKVTVEVTEEDGDLTMKVTYPEKGIKFQNKYKKPTTSVATGDDSDMSIWLGLMTVSMAAILLIVMDPYMKRRGRFSR